jgi:hypothetical protein
MAAAPISDPRPHPLSRPDILIAALLPKYRTEMVKARTVGGVPTNQRHLRFKSVGTAPGALRPAHGFESYLP